MRRPVTSLGRTTVVKGEIFSGEDLFLDAKIEGKVELPGQCLTVGKDGDLRADVRARDVDVAGHVRGNLDLDGKLTLRKEAILTGDVKTASITIEDGASFKGSIDIVRPTTERPADSAGQATGVSA
jgi:cytoskeletal protein CcmA (bactofilin family)